MAVEITGLPPVTVQGNGKSSATNPGQENAGQGAAPSSADVVTLSSQATQIKAFEADMDKQPSMDGDRIENLKAAIDSGSYVIDPTRVAEKFIEFEFSLTA